MDNFELQMTILQAQTRRHFLRSLGSGVGTLFFGTSLASYAAAPNYAAARSQLAKKMGLGRKPKGR